MCLLWFVSVRYLFLISIFKDANNKLITAHVVQYSGRKYTVYWLLSVGVIMDPVFFIHHNIGPGLREIYLVYSFVFIEVAWWKQMFGLWFVPIPIKNRVRLSLVRPLIIRTIGGDWVGIGRLKYPKINCSPPKMW